MPLSRRFVAGVLSPLALAVFAASGFAAEPPASLVPSTGTIAPVPAATVPAVAPIRVALFADDGSLHGGDAVEKCLMMEPGKFQCFRVTAADIRAGALDKADVVVLGGGSGSKEAKTLTPEGCEKIKTFVKNGGGYIGICAGAYLASSYYPWSLHILNARVVDREHWARGGGKVELRFTPAGRERFALATPTVAPATATLAATSVVDAAPVAVDKETVTCVYNQGPLLAPDTQADLPAYDLLATFDTEIAKKGAPTGVMKGTTALASARFGQGKVLCISPHPEATKGLDGIIRRAALWVAPAKAASK